MGMRLQESRWFRTGQMAEHRLWCHTASDDDLIRSRDELQLFRSLDLLSTESFWEWNRLEREDQDRRMERSNRRVRCPICSGWAVYPPSPLADKYYAVVPKCCDCGWHSANQIVGANIMVFNPRHAFKLTTDSGRF